jgi:hypothetical protein
MSDGIFIGGGAENYATAQHLLLKYANRHGLIAGATGTGKTVTLQILAESFSANGVPVILSDVKGDLSGLGASGSAEFKLHGAFTDRAAKIGFDRLRLPRLSGDLLGSLRPAGPPGAHNGLRDGPAAAVAAPGTDRGAGGRAEHRLPGGR